MVVDDGEHEIFVNIKVMDVNNSKFPIFSNRVPYLKNDEGGLSFMCEVMEKYTKEDVEKDDDICASLKKELKLRPSVKCCGLPGGLQKESEKYDDS